MFKFLKELVDSAKEGIAEAKAELAEEAAAEQAEKEQAQAAGNARLLERLDVASAAETFAVALAAPYRQVFLRELEAARTDERPAVFLRCTAIPEAEVADWKKLLDRDFSVTDAISAQATVVAMAEQIDELDDDALALCLVRCSHLATGAAAVGYATSEQAVGWLASVLQSAVDNFSDWETYGACFLAGEPDAPGSNVLGRKFLAGAVDKLLKDDLSPWRVTPWPAQAPV